MKAILVIDVPDGYGTDDVLIDYVLHTKGEYKVLRQGGNHKARPMPQKNEIKNEEEFMNVCGWMYEVQTGMDIGWNDCIDEILGETE